MWIKNKVVYLDRVNKIMDFFAAIKEDNQILFYPIILHIENETNLAFCIGSILRNNVCTIRQVYLVNENTVYVKLTDIKFKIDTSQITYMINKENWNTYISILPNSVNEETEEHFKYLEIMEHVKSLNFILKDLREV